MIPPLDLTGMLEPERRALLDLLADFGNEEWDAPTECPAWTVKGVALHVLGDDLSLLSRQRDDATNGLVLYAEKHSGLDFRQLLDGFNEQWVEAATFLSPSLMLELPRLTGEWTASFYGAVDLDRLGEPVGFFGGRSADGAVELTLPQSDATAVLSRGRSRDEVRAAFEVSGDDALAERALRVISAMAAGS